MRVNSVFQEPDPKGSNMNSPCMQSGECDEVDEGTLKGFNSFSSYRSGQRNCFGYISFEKERCINNFFVTNGMKV
jgi:hypothetical protein